MKQTWKYHFWKEGRKALLLSARYAWGVLRVCPYEQVRMQRCQFTASFNSFWPWIRTGLGPSVHVATAPTVLFRHQCHYSLARVYYAIAN